MHAYLLASLFASSALAALTCRDEIGRSVDWFVALKHNNAFTYSYLDERDPSFKFSKFSLGEIEGGALVGTLLQIYYGSQLYFNYSDESVFVDNNKPNDFYSAAKNNITRFSEMNGAYATAFYNDEEPTGKKTTYYAHAKGVAAFDDNSGFWLIHSIPRWPNSERYAVPPSDTYGQSFICVTLKSSEFDKVGNQQLINRPNVYASELPASLEKVAPGFKDWMDDIKVQTKKNAEVLTTQGGAKFTSIAKSKAWGGDLYEDMGESYDVTNVDTIALNGLEWTIHQDHSKWAISTEGSWVCIGDINRQFSQEKRGGGTLCHKDGDLHSAFKSAISQKEEC
ncbi:hypothetical protein AAMO2058_000851000 [Amorphochlora amoebiformis]